MEKGCRENTWQGVEEKKERMRKNIERERKGNNLGVGESEASSTK